MRAISLAAPTSGNHMRFTAVPARLRAFSTSSGFTDGSTVKAAQPTTSTHHANARRPIMMAVTRVNAKAGNPAGPRG
jgi:hypothetical protein